MQRAGGAGLFRMVWKVGGTGLRALSARISGIIGRGPARIRRRRDRPRPRRCGRAELRVTCARSSGASGGSCRRSRWPGGYGRRGTDRRTAFRRRPHHGRSGGSGPAPRAPARDELSTLTDLPRRTVRSYIQHGLVDRPEGAKRGAYYTVTDGDAAILLEQAGPGPYTASVGNLTPGETPRSGSVTACCCAGTATGSAFLCRHPRSLHGDPIQAGLTPHQVPEHDRPRGRQKRRGGSGDRAQSDGPKLFPSTIGNQAINVVCRVPGCSVAETTLYRDDEHRLEMEARGRSWSFDADGWLLRLVTEAKQPAPGRASR